jgi:hypothetical protein
VPELPDVTIYLDAMGRRLLGEPCLAARATGLRRASVAQPEIGTGR